MKLFFFSLLMASSILISNATDYFPSASSSDANEVEMLKVRSPKVKLKVQMGSIKKGCTSFALRICEVFIVLTNNLEVNPHEALAELSKNEKGELRLAFNKKDLGPGFEAAYFQDGFFRLEAEKLLDNEIAAHFGLPEISLPAGSFRLEKYGDRFEFAIH